MAFQLLRVGEAGHESPVVRTSDGRFLDLRPIAPDVDARLLTPAGRAAAAIAAGVLPEVSIEGRRIGSPIARAPSIVCVGMNYAAHAAESGQGAPTT